jgi:hypothetical protein
MRFLQALRALLQTWQGVVLSIIAALGAIYYGPKKMLETWDWYWDRWWDNEVYFLISRRKLIPQTGNSFSNRSAVPPPKEMAYRVKEIADVLGRKEASVEGSIRRLRRRGKIEGYQDGWRARVP